MTRSPDIRIHCIPGDELGHFLKREQRGGRSVDPDLRDIFHDILTRANEFVPSEAGSIFLDDPVAAKPPQEELALIACFGEVAHRLVGLRVSADRGIVGHVYRTGETYVSDQPEQDGYFWGAVDGASRFRTRSVVCAPLCAEGRVIGVLELINHRERPGYGERDLRLLQIFAQTTSAFIVNAMDAQRSREMAKRDDLTGLYNDRHLHASLNAVIARALETGDDCGLIFLDLDHFKSVNDVHGHIAGSRVLAEVGAILHQILPGQSIPARYGGDEFVIVLPGASRQEVLWVAETVRKNIEDAEFLAAPDPSDPVNYPALKIRDVITCSVGASTLTEVVPDLVSGAEDPLAVKNELIRRADACMYRAKQDGRNTTIASWRSVNRRAHSRKR